MGRFTNPRDLYFGEGARHEVKNFKGSKAVIVSGGSSMRRGGFLQDVQADLESAGMEVKLYEGVESDPSVETVMKGAQFMSEFGPDWIIAIGGGSPIDAAKAMWIKYEYPECTFEDMCKVFGLPELRKKAHFCAISSTSGTATEVTAFSIITDYEKGIKFPIADFEITPDVAIVDPELTYTMPAKLCAHTGMDALTHCYEAYVSVAASMFTDANALHGIREITEWLPLSYTGDKIARQHMHEAQCIAGIAFSSGLLGIVHSMAHKTGAAFSGGHIIHGCANAMYLGRVIKFNSKDSRAAERYAYVAREILHLPGETNEQLVDNTVQFIRDMNDKLNIPQGIKYYGQGGVKADTSIIDEKEFLEKLPTVAANALLDALHRRQPALGFPGGDGEGPQGLLLRRGHRLLGSLPHRTGPKGSRRESRPLFLCPLSRMSRMNDIICLWQHGLCRHPRHPAKQRDHDALDEPYAMVAYGLLEDVTVRATRHEPVPLMLACLVTLGKKAQDCVLLVAIANLHRRDGWPARGRRSPRRAFRREWHRPSAGRCPPRSRSQGPLRCR